MNIPKQIFNKPILTIVVPSYNVSRYLKTGLDSLISHNLLEKIEILVIDDGSKDNTYGIAKGFEKTIDHNGRKVVKVVKKQNGGHGSVINLGIKLATGKYFKLMDGDDFFDTKKFVELIKILEKEESDIILTDYTEYYTDASAKKHINLYDFMTPEKRYILDDIAFDDQRLGPVLSTTTCKTELLKRAEIKIDEKCFYVDMEYNFIVYIMSKSITHYPFDVYYYRLGREGQSMLVESLINNYSHHEKVCLRLISEFGKRVDSISQNKRDYIVNNIIAPLCRTQYMIIAEYIKDREIFLSFDKKLSRYPEFYNNAGIAGKIINLHRKTKGATVPANNLFRGSAKLFNFFKNNLYQAPKN